MSYNPAVDMPANAEQLNICIDYWFAKENEKAAADPAYQKLTREQIAEQFACYQPTGEVLSEPVMTTEQLFAQLRSIREVKLREYDQKISQLDRLIRLNPDYAAYPIERAEWDNYATALCNLPEQDGAPWDGGLALTPWPTPPA